MNIRTIRIWLSALAAAIVILSSAGVTTAVAQTPACPTSPCACGNATISVDQNLCGIELCESNSVSCVTFGPGTHIVDCARLNRFRLRDCHGNLLCLPELGKCIRCVCARTGCCVDICMESSMAECLILRVTPSICVGC
ncbi:MAG: hypothetical protein JWQ98_77 [Chlorobi bacterium]|nr:hypothetical protein [Chlorobiota bacterium]